MVYWVLIFFKGLSERKVIMSFKNICDFQRFGRLANRGETIFKNECMKCRIWYTSCEQKDSHTEISS